MNIDKVDHGAYVLDFPIRCGQTSKRLIHSNADKRYSAEVFVTFNT